ncbi:MAG: hypothetical protein GY832_44090 [Chloroflexi bacterium]|nr:hypothetical protein [Chloroflexota bacterium]
MKWYVICWVTVLTLIGNPIKIGYSQKEEGKVFDAAYVIAEPIFHDSNAYALSMRHWRMTVYVCGAYVGQEIVHRGKLARRRRQMFGRKRHRNKKQDVQTRSQFDREHSVQSLSGLQAEMQAKQESRCRAVNKILLDCPNPPVKGKLHHVVDAVQKKFQDSVSAFDETVVRLITEPEATDEAKVKAGDTKVPLRIVLRPGLILTKRGIQLRPLIARLGMNVDEYRQLWKEKSDFEAAIEHNLHSSCAMCGGKSGFRQRGSDKRSVIPPGSKKREWFRIKKVKCRDCGANTRILPTFCIPFKSHHARTIQNALENCWRRNNSYRDTTAILNQSRTEDGQYRGHTLPYEWTLWLGGLTIHLPQFLVWLGFKLPIQGLTDEFFLK